MASIVHPSNYVLSTTATTTASIIINGASVTIPSTYSSGILNSGAYGNITYTTGNSNLTGAGLHVTSDAKFEGNIEWKGRDLGKLLATIEKRLAILEPNPKKLEKFEALQKAYDHYKLLEALCHLEDDDDN